ncbi:MAG: iron-containing alcohol dehydrogenase [Candidatus Atabeyarchaeum deiterrae]
MFKCPLIYFGTGAIDRIAEIKAERVLLVTDKTLKNLGVVDEVQKRLKDGGTKVAVFDEVEPDPKDTTVARCVQLATEFEPDLIIGLGGGSSIDVAKGTFFNYERPDVKLCNMSPLETYNLRTKAKLIAIPTTSGTGSEASLGCVITDSESGNKMSLACYELVPDVAILDPTLAYRMPPKLRATTGIDVLAHGIESYITQMHTDFSDAHAMKAIQTVFEYLEKSFKTGDETAMEKMHYAATFAGIAMNNSGLGIAHAMGHSIGALLHLPHGAAVGFALPYAIEFCAETSKERYSQILRMLDIKGAAPEDPAKRLSAMIRELLTKIQLPTTIRGLGIADAKFEKLIPNLVKFSSEDPTSFTSPRNATNEDFTKIFDCMLRNKSIDF